MKSQNEKRENDDFNMLTPEAPEINDISYNCTKCSSQIEILSISEENNTIEFKCKNKNTHGYQKMKIKEYLESMEIQKQKNIEDDAACETHSLNGKKKNVGYCFDCKQHLCNECIQSRTHIKHNKSYIMEICPIQEDLDAISEIIKNYENKISNLKLSKDKEIENLKIILNKEKDKEKEKYNRKIELNKENNKKEIQSNYERCLSDIEKIKKRAENEISKRNKNLEKEKDYINNKYKLLNEEEKANYLNTIKKLDNSLEEKIKNSDLNRTIENLNYFIKINKIAYDTYNACNDNYFNNININNILLSYNKNEYIKNQIMKKIFKDNFEERIKVWERQKDENIDNLNKIVVKEGDEKEEIKEKEKKHEIKGKLKEDDERNDIKKKFEKEGEEKEREDEMEKRLNDVNYWKVDNSSNDDIMKAVLNDLD